MNFGVGYVDVSGQGDFLAGFGFDDPDQETGFDYCPSGSFRSVSFWLGADADEAVEGFEDFANIIVMNGEV